MKPAVFSVARFSGLVILVKVETPGLRPGLSICHLLRRLVEDVSHKSSLAHELSYNVAFQCKRLSELTSIHGHHR
jgi:hypothetical protein